MAAPVRAALLPLLDRFRPTGEVGLREAFQARVLVGQCLLGIVVATFSGCQELFFGDRVSGWIIAAFGVSLAGQLLLMRLGAAMSIVVWACIMSLGAFLVADSVVTTELQPEQLPWLTLLPLAALVLVGPRGAAEEPPSRRPVAVAAVLAIVLGAAIVIAHEKGLTFGRPRLPMTPGYQIATFAPFVVSVTGMMWLYDLALRNAENELRTLRKLLSTCAWCKKMHDEQEGWVTLERYMLKRESTLTHGICASCAQEHFPSDPGPVKART